MKFLIKLQNKIKIGGFVLFQLLTKFSKIEEKHESLLNAINKFNL